MGLLSKFKKFLKGEGPPKSKNYPLPPIIPPSGPGQSSTQKELQTLRHLKRDYHEGPEGRLGAPIPIT